MINAISRYCTPSLNCLLFGDVHLNFNTNSVIFIAVKKDTLQFLMKYIHLSQ